MRIIFQVVELFKFASLQGVNCSSQIDWLFFSISLRYCLFIDDFKVSSQFNISICFLRMEDDYHHWKWKCLSLSYKSFRNFWSWLSIVGSRWSTRSLGTILASRHLVNNLLCDTYHAYLSFNLFSLIAWYPACQSCSWRLLLRIFGVYSSCRTHFLLLRWVSSCFLTTCKSLLTGYAQQFRLRSYNV